MSAASSLKLSTEFEAAETPGLRPCPLCGSRQFRSVFEPIKKCQGCGLCLVNPLGAFRGENETRDYFVNEYLPLQLANLEGSLAERREHIAAIRRNFQLPARPRHLDVGCATGFMLAEAKAAGWDPVGVETSEFAATYASEHTGCSVFAGTLRKAEFPSEAFDVVTLMDVIEHVPAPVDLMNEIFRVLRPGGVVFVVTPNFGSFFVWLYGPKAYGVWPDQHVLYFQPSTIAKLLRKAGFARVISGSKDFYVDNLRNLLGRKEAQRYVGIKYAFGKNSSLIKLRRFANRVLMHVPIGDKVIAFAQK